MRFRSSNSKFTHFQGDVLSNVDDSSHGVQLSGGSTGGVVESCGDEDNVAIRLRGKGTGRTNIGNSSAVTQIGAAGSSQSTSGIALVQRYRVDFTVPALSSGASDISTVTVVGLTTNSILVLQARVQPNSTVVGVALDARCSTADELVITYSNNSISSISGSTQSGYLLQIAF